MTGLSAQLVSHVVRRGISEVSINGAHHGRPQSGSPQASPFAFIALAILLVMTFVVCVSLEYTVGNLMAKLAMIESTTTTTIIESRPPAYSEEPDAPLDEKKSLIDETDVEIVTIKHKPITTSVKATIMHLHRVGGFSGRWRGFRESIIYQTLINVFSHALGFLFAGGSPIFSKLLAFSVATLILCRFRMVWTHAMIAAPSSKPWYRRYCSRKNARVLLLPTLVYVLSMMAMLVAPLSTWYAFGAFELVDPQVVRNLDGCAVAFAIFQALSGPVVALLVAIFLAIPANATLTRIEACLLPEDDQTIVPFDRESLMAEIDLTVRGAPGKLFATTWKSVSFSTRTRVLSIYAKMVLFQVGTILVNSMLAVGVLYITGSEQFGWILLALSQ